MRTDMRLALLTLVLFAGGPVLAQAVAPGLDPIRLGRARSNYEALRDGRRAVGDLSILELEDVAVLDRVLRGQTLDPRTPSQRCVDDERRKLDGSPSPLAQRVIDIKCREAGEPRP